MSKNKRLATADSNRVLSSETPEFKVRITVIGDASASTLAFVRSALTGGGSEDDYCTLEKSHRIIRDVFIDSEADHSGFSNILSLRNSNKQKKVRLQLTAQSPNKLQLITDRSDAVIFLFRLGESSSLEAALSFKKVLDERLSKTIGSKPFFLVGNGSSSYNDELDASEIRALDKHHKGLAEDYKMKKYFEVSTKTGHNISKCLTDVIKQILRKSAATDTSCSV